MVPEQVTRVDMHCHSTASEVAKLGVQRSVGLPECATPPEEVYELAKRRGMDFVTITDHDTIDGCLELADRPDCFISEELTARFAGTEHAVHVLCYGIDMVDHEFLQANARDLESCVTYLRERDVTCALAHPFFNVAAPLTSRHRRRLAELFGIWETRNGARAPELNMPAATYVETHGGTGIGGSDDHAGVDIGRTFTEAPPASTPEEFLRHVREGRAAARGDQGSAAKWAHAALALATRTLVAEPAADGSSDGGEPVDPRLMAQAVFGLARRVVSDGVARGGEEDGEIDAAGARALLRSWLDSVELGSDPRELIALMQSDRFAHAGLERRARRTHERRLEAAVAGAKRALETRRGYAEAAGAFVEACVPAVPYVPATAILGSEKAKLSGRDGEPLRVAVAVDGSGSMHGVTHTVTRLREHGVPGWDVEVVGTDARVDRRLPAAAEVELPFYPGMSIGVPVIPDLVSSLAEGRFDLIHLASPGPVGIGCVLAARVCGIPLIGSYHTEFGSYAAARTGDETLEAIARVVLATLYGQCEVVLSPSPATDESLAGQGIDPERIRRWGRGVEHELFGAVEPDRESLPGELKVLYAGRLTHEKGIDLLIDSFLQARERDPRLHLLLAGGGPEEEMMRVRLGDAATFLGWLQREDLARVYASCDLFLFCSQTDTYGQVVTEAQAAGLPVVAVDAGGPPSLIRDRDTGWLCDPDPEQLAAAVAQLAASPFLRERIARLAREEVSGRTWERSMSQLADGYGRALAAARRKPEPTPLQRAA